MLRTLVALLLLANLAFWGWSQGWLDGVVGVKAIGDREPERLARQVHPESVRVLAPQAASGASAATTCLEAGPFTPQQAEQAQGELAQAAPGVMAAPVQSGQAVRLRVEADAAMAARLTALRSAALGSGFMECGGR